MKIHVKESTMVKPAKKTPRQDLWLSNIDLIQVRIHMGTLHFYKPNPSIDFRGTGGLLKEALSQVLVHYYPAAGRLRRGCKDGRLEVECNGEGVLFVEAEADSTVNDIAQSWDVADQLFPTVDYSSGDISSYPLLLFQVTYFKCGGICVGAGIHHTFGDGASLMQLMGAWAQTSLLGLPLEDTPFLDRTLLHAGQYPPSPPIFPHTEYQPPHPFPHNPPSSYKSTSGSDSTIVTLNLTPLQLKALKAKAMSTTGGDQFSTYEVLVAHTWRCACFAGEDDGDQVTRLSIIVDGRARLRPKLPRGYFGNALFHARPVALSSRFRRESLGRTAEKIRKEISKMTNEYLRSAINYLERHPNIEDLVPKEGNPIFHCTTFCIVDWTRKNIYELDFGWGRPFYVRLTMNEGKGFIMESQEKDGSLVLAMCLKRNQVLKFKKLFYEFLQLPAASL